MTPTNKAESMGEVEEEMGSSRDHAHTTSDGQGNPTLADRTAVSLCRRCSECAEQDHHWCNYGAHDDDGEPFMSCKHCDALREMTDDDFED